MSCASGVHLAVHDYTLQPHNTTCSRAAAQVQYLLARVSSRGDHGRLEQHALKQHLVVCQVLECLCPDLLSHLSSPAHHNMAFRIILQQYDLQNDTAKDQFVTNQLGSTVLAALMQQAQQNTCQLQPDEQQTESRM